MKAILSRRAILATESPANEVRFPSSGGPVVIEGAQLANVCRLKADRDVLGFLIVGMFLPPPMVDHGPYLECQRSATRETRRHVLCKPIVMGR